MKSLNELGGLRAFRVDTIGFMSDGDEDGNALALIAIPENFLPIALTGKIGALLCSPEGVNSNETQNILFGYSTEESGSNTAQWTGWSADIGSLAFTTPVLRIGTDKPIGLITSEGFEEISKSTYRGTIRIKAKPDRPLYVVGVSSTLNAEY